MEYITPNAHLIDLPRVHDPRGDLIFIEGRRHIPFDVARVYYIYNVPVDAERGAHAHKDLQQVIIPLSGTFRVTIDDGHGKSEFWLRNPSKGLFVDRMSWRLLDGFSQGAVAMVLASLPYDEDDYYRDYEDFIAAVGGRADDPTS